MAWKGGGGGTRRLHVNGIANCRSEPHVLRIVSPGVDIPSC